MIRPRQTLGEESSREVRGSSPETIGHFEPFFLFHNFFMGMGHSGGKSDHILRTQLTVWQIYHIGLQTEYCSCYGSASRATVTTKGQLSIFLLRILCIRLLTFFLLIVNNRVRERKQIPFREYVSVGQDVYEHKQKRQEWKLPLTCFSAISSWDLSSFSCSEKLPSSLKPPIYGEFISSVINSQCNNDNEAQIYRQCVQFKVGYNVLSC